MAGTLSGHIDDVIQGFGANFTGGGGLYGQVSNQRDRAPNLDGAGALSATTTGQRAATSNTAGGGTLSASRYQNYITSLTPGSAGTLEFSTMAKLPISPNLAGAGALSATAVPVHIPVTFDAVGPEVDESNGTPTLDLSFVHTPGSVGAHYYAVVAVSYYSSASLSSCSATYGGQSMTLIDNYRSGNMGRAIFGIATSLTGAQTVNIHLHVPGTFQIIYWGVANSLSYNEVGSINHSRVLNTSSYVTTHSITVSSDSNRMIANSIVTSTSAPDTASYNQTFRSSVRLGTAGLFLGDAVGASSVTFTATTAGGNYSIVDAVELVNAV